MKWLLAPAVAVVAVFALALAALLRYSVLEFVPGSLRPAASRSPTSAR